VEVRRIAAAHKAYSAQSATCSTPAPDARARRGASAAGLIFLSLMRARFSQLGLDVVGNTPGELSAIIKADIEKWAKVIKDAGITATD